MPVPVVNSSVNSYAAWNRSVKLDKGLTVHVRVYFTIDF